MGKVRKPKWAAVWVAMVFLLSSLTYANQPLEREPDSVPRYLPRHYPYADGEKALYEASWNGIPVASALIQTTPISIDGKGFYQVRVEAKTSKVLDLIWRMRDTIQSTFEAKSLAPSRFVFNQRENRRITETEARYDGTNKKWLVQRQRGRKIRKFEFDSPNTLDPITAAYLARSLDFNIGDQLFFNIFGGKSRYLLELEIEGREAIEIGSKKVDAFKITPRITNITKDGYAGRVREATVWISADEKRTPLMVASKVFIGTVYIEMVSRETGSEPASGLPPS